MVLGPGGGGHAGRMEVLLDGRPIPPAWAGGDVHGATVEIASQRLYELVDLPRVGHHVCLSRR